MKTRVWIALLGFFLAVAGEAQSSLGVDSINFTYTTPTYYNNTDLYKVNIVNYGPQVYSGTVTVWYAVDSSGTGAGPVVPIDSSNTANVSLTTFGPGAPDSAYIIISPALFRTGINTVVIWPRVSSGDPSQTHDSLRLNVLVLGWLGIENHDIHIKPSLFPNPARQELWIAHPDFTVERVRVFDALGKIVLEEKFCGKINISSFVAGAYFLEVQSAGGKSARYRFIKE